MVVVVVGGWCGAPTTWHCDTAPYRSVGAQCVSRHVFPHRLAPEAALPAEERRGALPHPAQLAADLLRRAVGDTTQRLVQSGKSWPGAGSW